METIFVKESELNEVMHKTNELMMLYPDMTTEEAMAEAIQLLEQGDD